jgi:hypothetical protein
MIRNLAWIPALTAAALIVGCDSKPKDTIPTTAPMAASEPQQILAHLKYLAVRKDMKDLPVISPSDLTGLYGNAWWFHTHAGQMGISLTQEEIQGLGVEQLKTMGYLAPSVTCKELQDAQDKVAAKTLDKLPENMVGLELMKVDKLPDAKDPNKAIAKDYETVNGTLLRAAYQAGIYRLMKGVPTDMWKDVNVMEIKQNAGNTKAKDVYLGFKGTSIMQVTVSQKSDNTYGIIYIYYKAQPKKLLSLLKEAQAEK